MGRAGGGEEGRNGEGGGKEGEDKKGKRKDIRDRGGRQERRVEKDRGEKRGMEGKEGGEERSIGRESGRDKCNERREEEKGGIEDVSKLVESRRMHGSKVFSRGKREALQYSLLNLTALTGPWCPDSSFASSTGRAAISHLCPEVEGH